MSILTREEKHVLVFVLSVSFLGIGITYFFKTHTKVNIVGYFNEEFSKVNINTATEESLISVKGIGKKFAQRIIKYRQDNYGFRTLEELKQIKGISDKKLQRLKDSFCVQ